MRAHDFAEGLGLHHPLMKGFDAYLEKDCGFDEQTVDFLIRHSFFAYPRTLWIKLAVNIRDEKAEQDIRARHRLNPKTLGRALNNWILAKPALNKIVFDLTEVTIFAAEQIRDLFVAALPEKGGGNYYVCAQELASQLSSFSCFDPKQQFHFERDLIDHLRDVPSDRKCILRLPKIVDLTAFEQILRLQVTDEKLRDRDAIVFDLTDVTTLSFEAHCMFAPVIHSLAHSHGILSEVSVSREQLRSKVVQDIVEHGSLRAMRSNLIHTSQNLLRRQDPQESKGGVLPMHTFIADDSGKIQKMCYQRLEEIFSYYYLWTTDIVRIPAKELRGLPAAMAEAKSLARKEELIKEIVWELWDIIHELVDNVAGHSRGLGYVMLELDPQPKKGLNIYVGDTGIGLALGLENSYKMDGLTHLTAATMTMSLAEKLDERRQLHGPLKQGGRGLEHVKILLRQYSGLIRIRTGDAAATFSLRKRVSLKNENDLFNLQGTHIHVKIPSRWKAL